MAWGLIALVVGILYGWMAPGHQDKGSLLKTGIIWGLIFGLILALLGFAIGSNPLFLGAGGGILGFVVAVLVVVLLFVIGVWVGDLLEGRRPSPTT